MINEQLRKANLLKEEPAFIENLGALYDNMFSAVLRGYDSIKRNL